MKNKKKKSILDQTEVDLKTKGGRLFLALIIIIVIIIFILISIDTTSYYDWFPK